MQRGKCSSLIWSWEKETETKKKKTQEQIMEIRNIAKAWNYQERAVKVEGAKGKKGKKKKESKIINCDRWQVWIMALHIMSQCYWFMLQNFKWWRCSWHNLVLKTCKLLAKKAITEDRNIDQKYMKYTNELNQKMKFIEALIKRKVGVTALQKLQRKAEENENKIELMEKEEWWST